MIDLLFQIINLGIIIGLGFYIFRYKMMPGLQTQLEQEQLIMQNLRDEHAQLMLSQTALEESVKAQDSECAILQKKIDQWKDRVAQYMSIEDAEEKRIFIALERKLELQSYNHALRARQKELAPAIVETLEKELKEYFSQQDKVDQYMRSAIVQLRAEV
jgi:hypothetical protein